MPIFEHRLARDRDAKHETALAGETAHQNLERREQGHKQRASMLRAGSLDPLTQILVEVEYLSCAYRQKS